MEDKNTHIAVKILKVFLWVSLIVVILAAGIRLSLKTKVVQEFAKSKIESIANESINGEFRVSELSGDLWKEVRLTNVYIGSDDTLAFVDTLYANYDILSLLSGTFNINKVEAKYGKVNLIESEQSPDSVTSFTVQEIVKPDSSGESESGFKFEIDQIVVRNTNVYMYSPSLLPDSMLSVENISMDAGFSMTEEIEASLSDLSFNIKEGRLPRAIEVNASGGYKDQTITLQDFVVNSGRSLLQANAFVNLQDSSVNSTTDLKPLSTEDIKPYVTQEIPSKEITLTLKAKGTFSDLEVQLNADASFVKDLELIAQLDLSSTPTLKQFGLKGRNLNIAELTNDSIKVQTGVFQATMDGSLTSNYEEANISWGFTVEGLRYEEYNFRRFFGSGTLVNGKVLVNLDVTTSGQERLTTNSTFENIFAEDIDWEVGYVLKNFNAKYWSEEAPRTDISINGFIDGKGFELSDEPWIFRVVNSSMRGNDPAQIRRWEEQMSAKFITPVEIGDQSVSFILLDGTVNKDSVTVKGFTDITESRLNFNASVSDFLTELPSFNYRISTKDFNVAEFTVAQDVQTSIDMEVSGKGSGFDLENLSLKGFAHIDTSIVNGADLDLLDAEYEIRNGILFVENAELRSDIANIDFAGRRNIRDETDPDNVLSLDIEIKNTQPLASLADVEVLQVMGSVSAEIKENQDGFLQCTAEFKLNDIVVDELLRAGNINGKGEFELKDNKETGSFELNIMEPEISGTSFQDIKLQTNSTVTEDSLYGDYSLEVKDNDSGQILNDGLYDIELDSLNINVVMNKLDLVTNNQGLSLQEDFRISIRDKVIRTDSLILRSPNGAFLSLSVPYADSLRQQIWVVGENFNFGILQEIILNERLVDGVLFGDISINKTKEDLTGSGNIELQNLEYEGLEADIFNLNFNAENKRITSELTLIQESQRIISGNLDVPFDLGDPEDFSDKFFDQKVSGNIKIEPTSLSKFKTIMEKFDITGTEGILSFEGSLSGTAGAPNFEGSLNIEDPVLSEIPLDSVFANFGYNHTEEKIFINAEVLAARQKAADVEVDLPFSYNFRTFKMNTVNENEPVSATITTKDFNLAVFNDFLNKDFTKKLEGTLNGKLTLKGTENSLSSEGSFDLTRSSLEVPIAGIKLDGIKSRLEFGKDKVVIKEFTMKSGKGDFNASGDINLDGLTPTTLNVRARANQFKLANTDEYNMVVDINSRLQGSVFTPKATGRFAVKNGFVVLDNFGDQAIEEVQLEGEEASSFSLYDSLAIDMEFAIERNFFVRNRRYLDMEIEITGDLDAQKETRGELSLFGSLVGEGGYVRPLGKRFELEEAELVFSGPPENPDLNIKSVYIPPSRKGEQEVMLYYIIKGTAEEPVFSFESNPTMEKQDIVCYTLFNRPCYALDSWQNALTQSGGSSPTDLLAGVLLDEVEALATRELGVDVVQIDNTRVGNEVGTSIKTGWYLNERTFFAIINEITSSDPKTLFILEYALSKTWDLIITEGEDSNRRGVDVQWQFDY